MRILITGSNGQLGLELANQFDNSNKGYEIIKTDIHNLDITDREEVLRMMKLSNPQIVINCAAYTNVDNCESDELNAFRVNSIGAQNLSIAAFCTGAKVVQISTDYVFEGTGNTPKREYDAVNPQTIYGKSKALGEKLVRESNPRHLIIRTSWLYGKGRNFVRTMLKLSKEKKVINVVDDQVGSPTSTVDLAKCIINLIQSDQYGTFHASCEGQCSWFDLASKIFEIKGIKVQLNRISSEQLDRPAMRPKYSVLENYMLKLLGANTFRNWDEALYEYLKGDYEL
ncbi:MAG: dTDP-4-dehydrorhamnose reductase [Acetivibrionales bacterium]